MHVGVHRIARNNHRVSTTAVLAVERAVFKTGRSALGFRMTHAWFLAPWAARPLDIGKVGLMEWADIRTSRFPVWAGALPNSLSPNTAKGSHGDNLILARLARVLMVKIAHSLN
jgi:hypothetical protein